MKKVEVNVNYLIEEEGVIEVLSINNESVIDDYDGCGIVFENYQQFVEEIEDRVNDLFPELANDCKIKLIYEEL